ncbi:MAG: putative quinol monooxygenase [Pseudomonadota bacterium]
MATAIIISGTIDMPPDNVAPALEAGASLIRGALTEPGCLDYDWCPEPLTPGRIRVFERWDSEAALAAHFRSEWYHGMRAALGEFGITASNTAKYRVDLEEPVYDKTMTARADFFTATD